MKKTDTVHTSEAGRNILIAVTGLSPQIVTETLYALAVAGEHPWLPHEIHLITTAEGARQARLNLLSEQPGWFHRLCRDYALPAIHFDESHIHAIRDARGRLLDDIRQPEDNDAAADFITDVVRGLTEDPRATVHASIAGGRKTMGFYLGYALSLYGRPQDRLSHVLVNAPYEGHPQFFYPTPYESVIQIQQNNKSHSVDAREARVTLADIPFVRLRDGQPKRLIKGQARFSESVAAAQRALQPPSLVLNPARQELLAAGIPIPLAPADLAFYAMLARRAQRGDPPIRWTDPGLVESFRREYAPMAGLHSGHMEQAETRLNGPDVKGWFLERKSKCHQALIRALGETAAQPYLTRMYGHRPSTRYGLALAPEAISFQETRQP